MTIKIKKWGNSQEIRIPKTILDDLAWLEIEKLFANYTGSYQPQEIDWGKKEGKEIW